MGSSAVFVAEKCQLFLLAFLLIGSRWCTCDDWDQSLVLDNDGKYLVHWSLEDDETIKFMVEVETQGYVGFGLSMAGGMAGSDIVTGWIDNGIATFQDRFGLGNFIPEIDDSQDWELLSGRKNETHTVLTFRRELNTCDKEQDVVIDRNRIRLIYAYSEDVPKSPEDLQYHQWRRGIKGASLLDPPTTYFPEEKEIYYWDVLTANFTLTSEIKSMYWCAIVKGAELHTKHHVIKVEPLTSPGGEPYAHHAFLMECSESEVSPEEYEDLIKRGSYPCPLQKRRIRNQCLTIFAGWAVGAEEMSYAKHAGLPLEAGPPKYYLLSVHLDNHNGTGNLNVQSGMRLWYTPELRKYDLGSMVAAASFKPQIVIPPAQNSYVVAGHMNSECLTSGLPPEGVNIAVVTLHAHLLGRRIIVRHFRDNKELKPIAHDDHFDFRYQQAQRLREEVRLLPGDHVVVECTYNSSKRNSPTFGGTTTLDEMCVAFLTHYPRSRISSSLSQPSAPLLFGLTGSDGYTPNTTDSQLRRRLKAVDWRKVNASLMEAATRFSPHESFCRTDNGTTIFNMVTYPRNYEPYSEDDGCSERKSKHRVSAGSDNGPSFATFVFSYTVIFLYAYKTHVHCEHGM